MIDSLEKLSRIIAKVLLWTAGGFMAAMITLTCANIFLRIVWVPIAGTYELMGYFGAILTACALGYTQIKRGHIAVDILVLRFPGRTQRILNGVNHFICMIFFPLVAWQIAKYGRTLWKTGEVTETLQIVYYPFAFGVALGCAALSLVFFSNFLKCLFKERDGEKWT
jgi:TRAP-type C4-dicarboxylate transport system permease small subunit